MKGWLSNKRRGLKGLQQNVMICRRYITTFYKNIILLMDNEM